MMNKKAKGWLITSVSVAACGLIATGVTLAFRHTQTPPVVNDLKAGTVANEIYENNSSTPSSVNTLTGKKKTVQVRNEGTIRAYMRVKLVPSWKFTSGKADTATLQLSPMPTAITGSSIDLGDVQLKLKAGWKDNWLYKDGYFYYKSPVNPGAMTSALLDSVALRSGLKDEVLNEFQLDVLSESIQASYGQKQPALTQAWGGFTLDANGKIKQ